MFFVRFIDTAENEVVPAFQLPTLPPPGSIVRPVDKTPHVVCDAPPEYRFSPGLSGATMCVISVTVRKAG
jgi:hypothetical protein